MLDRSDWKLCEAIPAGPGVAPQNLFRKLESLGDSRCGTISVNYRKCGKSKCGCARKDHPGRGPQYLWNVSIGGKTQARNSASGAGTGKDGTGWNDTAPLSACPRKLVEVNDRICQLRPARTGYNRSVLWEFFNRHYTWNRLNRAKPG